MTKAIRISAIGGPEVMEYVDVDLPAPGRGEAPVSYTHLTLPTSDLV